MRMSALFGAKKLRIFEIYDVSAQTDRGFEPVRTFCGQGGRGSIFSNLCERLL